MEKTLPCIHFALNFLRENRNGTDRGDRRQERPPSQQRSQQRRQSVRKQEYRTKLGWFLIANELESIVIPLLYLHTYRQAASAEALDKSRMSLISPNPKKPSSFFFDSIR